MKPRKDSASLTTQLPHPTPHHRILIDKSNEIAFTEEPRSRSISFGFRGWTDRAKGQAGGGGREKDDWMDLNSTGKRGWRDVLRTVPSRLTPTHLLLAALLLTSYYLGRITASPSSRLPGPITKFTVPPSLFVPPVPYPPSSFPDSSTIIHQNRNRNPNQRVPNIVHYVYSLKPTPRQKSQPGGIRVDEEGYFEMGQGEEGEEFPYYAYLAVRSVIVNLKPDAIYFHHFNTPTGPWFDLLRPHLTLVPARVPTKIFGNELRHFAHRSDIIRLDALLHMGGIYLDIDTYVIRPFDEFLGYPVTLGMEAATDSRRQKLDPEGLCNGIIVAEPHASFLERWRSSYEDFRPDEWAQHSVARPWEIARRYPNELNVLDTRAFFWPGWWGEEVQMVHETDDYDFHKSGQYAYHAWESLAMKYLEKLDPVSIKTSGTSFNKMVRSFVGPTDEAVYAEWKRAKLR
ncbi:hypothetical protein FFLO_06115 [Filobasidium floriforme]|uniref:Glycosyltransferase family 32 protein n=1 Tax=Filobasidium floriforme TaxID=5210 RepID=A0A8K0JL61_9TREE|nr:nucleotide-diphospho-sugar transferase [Filobasidium floriforme]KAG7528492.1 hypothetical protein FFLO_06115 [Filobasidium floriforme]KAH8077784.1 nucleotide-diphospho-sugar transferase [Filobasidium floriforme]